MTISENTVDQVVEALNTAWSMQRYALDEFPLEYISKLIDVFRDEPNATYDTDHEVRRLCETIPTISTEDAYKLVGIKIGSLRDMCSSPN